MSVSSGGRWPRALLDISRTCMTKVKQYLIDQARAELALFGLPMASYKANIEGMAKDTEMIPH